MCCAQILLSGGNTLFAVDRWAKTGADELLRKAAARGAVVAGGSAGFIALCNGGHSDSMDPKSYKNPPGPLLNASCAAKSAVDSAWAYIRVPGIGLMDGLCCPCATPPPPGTPSLCFPYPVCAYR